MRLLLPVVALLAVTSAVTQAESDADYTSAQASRGATVYAQSCAQCHGRAPLQLKSAPLTAK
jgi:alcohol dehydrogenase (cytochrome c)